MCECEEHTKRWTVALRQDGFKVNLAEPVSSAFCEKEQEEHRQITLAFVQYCDYLRFPSSFGVVYTRSSGTV